MGIRIVPMEAHIEPGNPTADQLLAQIERAGRTCYKSEDKITDNSRNTFIAGIIKRGHEAVLEHGAISVRFICDRGVSHEIVRHRIANYCQESTRYCNYGNEKFGNGITLCQPNFWDFTGNPIPDFPEEEENTNDALRNLWKKAMDFANEIYLKMIALGARPQEARSVLPNSLKTEVVMTANPREWRHFFKMRCSPAAHPDMRYCALQLLAEFHRTYPVLFDDLYEEYQKDVVD